MSPRIVGRYAGMNVVQDPYLPRFITALLNPHGWPKAVVVDHRRVPWTGDMSTMLDDIERAGALPWPSTRPVRK